MRRQVRKTSQEAFDKILAEGLLPARRLQVYEYLYLKGPATAQEVENAFLDRGLPEGRHVNKRLPELRDQGVVAEVGEKKCDITGQHAILWDVTPSLPRPLPRTERKILPPIKHPVKHCRKCPLVAENDDGEEVCWLDISLRICDSDGRPPLCKLEARDFVVCAG